MEAFDFQPFTRERLGFALVRLGRLVGRFDQERRLPTEVAPVQIKGAPKMSSRLTVLLTNHAVERYGERTGRFMARGDQITEISRVWRHVIVKPEPPEWLMVDSAKFGTDQLFGEIADMVFVMVPHGVIPNCFVAKTVISNDRVYLPERSRKRRQPPRGDPRRARKGSGVCPPQMQAAPAPVGKVEGETMPQRGNRRAILGSLAALVLTAGPALVFVLLAGNLGISHTLQVVLFFVFLGTGTKAYLVLSDRFTRQIEDDTSTD